MKRNIETKLNSMTKSQISQLFIRMKGEKRKYSKDKMIYLLLKPLFQKYSMEINKKEYYKKEIPLNVKKYYEHLESELGEKLKTYHIPYEIWEEDGKYIFHTKYWGRPLNYSTITSEQLEAGEDWAKQKLRELHKKGLIHGDLINIVSSGKININRGNILFNEDTDEYRFIDMGFDKTKSEFVFNNENLYNEFLNEQKLLQRYETEYVKSVRKGNHRRSSPLKNPYDDLNFEDVF
jgi:hypothetical protein